MKEISFTVRGNRSNNNTGILCKKGQFYYITVTPQTQTLEDVMAPSPKGSEVSDANGWSNQWMFDVAPNMGLGNKMPTEPSMKLCAQLGTEMYPIGIDGSFCANCEGQLILFVNHNAWLSVKGELNVIIKGDVDFELKRGEVEENRSEIFIDEEKVMVTEDTEIEQPRVVPKAKNCHIPVHEPVVESYTKSDTKSDTKFAPKSATKFAPKQNSTAFDIDPSFNYLGGMHTSKYVLKESLIHTHSKPKKRGKQRPKKTKKIKWISNDKLKIRNNELCSQRQRLFEFERELMEKSRDLLNNFIMHFD